MKVYKVFYCKKIQILKSYATKNEAKRKAADLASIKTEVSLLKTLTKLIDFISHKAIKTLIMLQMKIQRKMKEVDWKGHLMVLKMGLLESFWIWSKNQNVSKILLDIFLVLIQKKHSNSKNNRSGLEKTGFWNTVYYRYF